MSLPDSKNSEVFDWKSFLENVRRFYGQNKFVWDQLKIFTVDEENELVRITTEEQFLKNIRYARGLKREKIQLLAYYDHQLVVQGIYRLRLPLKEFQEIQLDLKTDRWQNQLRFDAPLGICLRASIDLLEKGENLEEDLNLFFKSIAPEIFQKALRSQLVYNWTRQIHDEVFELLELLVDLVSTLLPKKIIVPALLNTLAMAFDPNTSFSQKNKLETAPVDRNYRIEIDFLRNQPNEYFARIRSLIERFLSKNCLTLICESFDSTKNFEEADVIKRCDSLLRIFVKPHLLINGSRFRSMFTDFINRSINFVLEKKKFPSPIANEAKRFNETLMEICFNYDMDDQVRKLLDVPSVGERIPVKIEKNQEISTSKKNKDFYEELAKEFRILSFAPKKTEKNTKTRDKSLPISYDSSNPVETLKFFAPMREKINELYSQLDRAIARADLSTVLSIEKDLNLIKPFSARFVADRTIPDGMKIRAGEFFVKTWLLLNDGSMPWENDDFQLTNLQNGIELIETPTIPVTAPHRTCSISLRFRAPSIKGFYESKWILSTRNRTFGPMIWCTIEVVADDPEPSPEPENFEPVPIALPDCFDLLKPFRSLGIEQKNSTNFPHSNNFEENQKEKFQTSSSANVGSLPISNEPMEILLQIGFTNEAENEILLKENQKDLTKVLEILMERRSR